MENNVISRRHYNNNNKRGNKENAQPADSSKTSKTYVSKTVSTTLAPLCQKSNAKEATLATDGTSQKVKPKQVNTKKSSGEAVERPKTVQKAVVKPKSTLSQAFLTEQAVRHRKLVAEVPKPPAAVPPTKPAPGMYKGKVVQSKIGAIWKSSLSVAGDGQKTTAKPSAPKVESRTGGKLMTMRSKSVADLPRRGVQGLQSQRSKSVCNGPPPVSKRTVSSRPTTGPRSAIPPSRSIPATVASSRNATLLPKAKGTQNSKPNKLPVVTDKRVSKPSVTSTISQFKGSMETAEERRAKLAEWLASKGKTLKRPAMGTVAPTKTKTVVKPNCQLKSQVDTKIEPCVESQPLLPSDPEPAAAQPEDDQKPVQPAHDASTPQIMNTTLDLLDNSEDDLPVDPEPTMSDIVVNLCEVLAAMETPSSCEDGPQQTNDSSCEVEMEDSAAKDECRDEKNELDDVDYVPEDVKVKSKDEEEEVDSEEDESDDYEEEDGDECSVETTPKKDVGASVVKYSVSTTPYLQRVKNTIEGEANASGSRRKSNIKDLKFLTPVRRSSRIHRQSSPLPGMLADHDPCVSSLAELAVLGDHDPTAYIYRRNPALLEDLHDQPQAL